MKKIGLKKRLISLSIILCLAISFSTGISWADPEDEGDWYGTDEGYYDNEGYYGEDYSGEYYTEEYYGEDYSEEYYYEEPNEYSGEYAEGYDEEAAISDADNWDVQYYEYGDTVEEEEKPQEEILPIVAEDGTIRKPVLSSGAAAVYCRNTGEMIFAKNADKRFSPYSITKLLTCLLAIQKLPLDQQVTISQEAASQGGSSMELKEGEVLTVEQLLYGTMILSGNDAAYALAETVSGDVDTFVALMNETVSNLGCKNTHFVNPNGLIDDVGQQYTTAKDFVEISKLAFNNETLKQIAGCNEYDMPATNMSDAYKMEGHNELLLEGKKGYAAGKTGYWDDTKATIAMDYTDGSLELIVVALGGAIEKRGTDCDQLIDYAIANIEGLKVVEKGQIVGNVRIKHGAVTRIEAVTDGESFVYLPKQASKELIQLTAVIDQDVTAPVKQGDPVGVYQVFLADEKIDEIPLIASQDVEEGWILSYLGISNKATVILIGLIALLILLIIIRAINISSARRRSRARS